MSVEPLHLAVALEGAGWHPAAWREPSARPKGLFSPRYWTDLARTAERGLLDLVTIEDSFGLQSSAPDRVDGRTDQVRGRLDALLIASLVGPSTHSIGLVPTVNVTHTEPFHVASATSTLDYVTRGRAGWRPQVSARAHEAAHVGRRTFPSFGTVDLEDPAVAAAVEASMAEAGDVVEVVRRLWDSWEDDAIIKDVATGRYIDRDKVHYVDFEGPHFSVKGPSIVPRPPQGQPVVVTLAHTQVVFELAARASDVVLVTPRSAADVGRWIDDVRRAEVVVDRQGPPLQIWSDLVVFLDDRPTAAADRLRRLEARDGSRFRSDAATFTGTPTALADQLILWHEAGLDGFRLRPGVIGHDLDAIVDGLVPELQRRGRFRTSYAEHSLRERLGLARPASRYAPQAV